MANADSLTRSIRDVLDAAEDSLAPHAVIAALTAAGVEFKPNSVRCLLRERSLAGEFVRSKLWGKGVYTLNPEFVLHARKADKPEPTPAEPSPEASGVNLTGALADEIIADGDRQLQTMPIAEPPAMLAERVASIAADLEDAIGDACDACLAHPVIKALTTASGAAHRAARQLGA